MSMYAYEDDCGLIFLQRSKQLHRDLFGVIITGLQILPPISFLPTFTALKTTSCTTTHLTSTSPSTTSFATAQSTTQQGHRVPKTHLCILPLTAVCSEKGLLDTLSNAMTILKQKSPWKITWRSFPTRASDRKYTLQQTNWILAWGK